jgi:hypothetical protein
MTDSRILTEENLAVLERRSQRGLLIVVVGTLLILVSLVIAIIYLSQLRNQSEQRARAAEALVVQRSGELNALGDRLEAARRAFIANDRVALAQQLDRALAETEAAAVAPTPIATPTDIPAPVMAMDQSADLKQALQRPIRAEQTIRVEVPPDGTEGSPPEHQVFIQFAGTITRGQIVELNRALREAGWNVQGASGERLARAANLNEVRYRSRDDRADAERLAAAITEAGVAGSPVRARQVGIIRAGTLEVWISN